MCNEAEMSSPLAQAKPVRIAAQASKGIDLLEKLAAAMRMLAVTLTLRYSDESAHGPPGTPGDTQDVRRTIVAPG